MRNLLATVLLLALTQNVFAQIWSVATPPSGVTAEMGGVDYNGTKFIAAGNDLKYISSPDGITWTDEGVLGAASNAAVYDVAWVPFLNRWVASTNVGLFTDAKIYSSTTGTGAWTQSSTGLANTTANIFANDGTTVIATAGEGKLLKSTNGTTWTIQDISAVWTTATIRGIEYANNQWIIVGSGGRIATSPNGTTWTMQSSPTGLSLQAIAFGGGRYVAIGPNNLAVWSTNGTAWTSATIGVSKNFSDITYYDGKFVAVGSDGSIVSSTDGATWTANTSNAGTGLFFNGIAAAGSSSTDNIVAVGGSSSATTLRYIAPPPFNDNCSSATTLTPSFACNPISGTTLNATPDTGPGACAIIVNGGLVNAVWYKFVATATAHNVTVDGDPGFDPVIGALNACGGTRPTGGNCTDVTFGGGIETMNLTGLTIGATYYIQVYDYQGDNVAASTFTICVTNPPPANDNCSGAIALTPGSTCAPTNGSADGATTDSGPGLCTNVTAGGVINAVWYKFVATASAHTVVVDGGAQFDAVIGALNSCGGTRPTGGGCTDNTVDDGVETMILTGLTIGSTYYIQVHDYLSGNQSFSTFTICILVPPINDECSGAINCTTTPGVWNNPVPTIGHTGGATQSLAPSLCNGFTSLTARDIWYRFTTNANGGGITINYNGDADIILEAFSGTCGALASLGCSDMVGNSETLILSGLASSTQYYLRAYVYNEPLPPFSFTGTLAASGTALPVELTAFNGKVAGPVNILNWETAAEVNVQWHIIERSADSRTWTEVTKLPAKNTGAQYSAEDRQPLPQAYYRLRSVDFDGREQLSNSIVLTRIDKGFNIASVFPSPTRDEVTVQFNTTSEERIRLRITDITGRLLLEQPIEAQKGLNTRTLSLANLPAGMYLIGMDNGAALSAPVRVMKE